MYSSLSIIWSIFLPLVLAVASYAQTPETVLAKIDNIEIHHGELRGCEIAD